MTDADDDALNACATATAMLRSIGFELAHVSMRSEACYYTMPGYHGAIRVAAHRYGGSEMRGMTMPVVGLVTFGHNQGAVSAKRLEYTVMLALGRYFYARTRREQSVEEAVI